MSAGVAPTTTMDVDQAEEQVSGGQGQGSVTPATTTKSAVSPSATGADGRGQEQVDATAEMDQMNMNDRTPELPPIFRDEIAANHKFKNVQGETDTIERTVFFSGKSNHGVLQFYEKLCNLYSSANVRQHFVDCSIGDIPLKDLTLPAWVDLYTCTEYSVAGSLQGRRYNIQSGSKSQNIITVKSLKYITRKYDERKTRNFLSPSPIGESGAIKILAKSRLLPGSDYGGDRTPAVGCAREIGAQQLDTGQRHESSSVVLKCGSKVIRSSSKTQYCAGSEMRLIEIAQRPEALGGTGSTLVENAPLVHIATSAASISKLIKSSSKLMKSSREIQYCTESKTRLIKNCIQSSELRSCPTYRGDPLTYQFVRPSTQSRDLQHNAAPQHVHDTTMHNLTRHYLYSPPTVHQPIYTSWSALISLCGTPQAIELILGDGKDETGIEDSGVIDWYKNPLLVYDYAPTNFCEEIQLYAFEHGISLERPETVQKRAIRWHFDAREEDFEDTFCGCVFWGGFKDSNDFGGSPQHPILNTHMHMHKPNVPALSAIHNPLHTILHCTTAVATLYTTLYDMCHQPSTHTPSTLLHYLLPVLSPYTETALYAPPHLNYLTMLHCIIEQRSYTTSTIYDLKFRAQFPRLSPDTELAPYAPPHLIHTTMQHCITDQRAYMINTTYDLKFHTQFPRLFPNTELPLTEYAIVPQYAPSMICPTTTMPYQCCARRQPEHYCALPLLLTTGLLTEFHKSLAKHYRIPQHSFKLQKKMFDNPDMMKDMTDPATRTKFLESHNQFLSGRYAIFQLWAQSAVAVDGITSKTGKLQSVEFSLREHTSHGLLQNVMIQSQGQLAMFLALEQLKKDDDTSVEEIFEFRLLNALRGVRKVVARQKTNNRIALPADLPTQLQQQAQCGLLVIWSLKSNQLYFSVPAAVEGQPTGEETNEFMRHFLHAPLYKWLTSLGLTIKNDVLPVREAMTPWQLAIADEHGYTDTLPTASRASRTQGIAPLQFSTSSSAWSPSTGAGVPPGLTPPTAGILGKIQRREGVTTHHIYTHTVHYHIPHPTYNKLTTHHNTQDVDPIQPTGGVAKVGREMHATRTRLRAWLSLINRSTLQTTSNAKHSTKNNSTSNTSTNPHRNNATSTNITSTNKHGTTAAKKDHQASPSQTSRITSAPVRMQALHPRKAHSATWHTRQARAASTRTTARDPRPPPSKGGKERVLESWLDMKDSAPPATTTTGEREHELNPLRKTAKKGKIESNTESKNHCCQDRKADGRHHIEVGTCVHLHRTRVEVKTPNYKKHETKQFLASQPMPENQMLPELLANFFTNSVVEVREVTLPRARTITPYDSQQYKIRSCSGKGKSTKRTNAGERSTRGTKRTKPQQNEPPPSSDREEEEERKRRIDKQRPRWEVREEGDLTCAHRTGIGGGENCTRRRSETSRRELCTQCEEATPLLQDYNDHILNGCAGCRPARHNWSHARHFPYGESTPYIRRHSDEAYVFHASACPLSEGRLPQAYMEEMLNHPRSGRTNTSRPIITLDRPTNTHEFILDRGEQIHPQGCLLCHHNIGFGERISRRGMYMNNLLEHWRLYGAAHSEQIAAAVEAGVYVDNGREFTNPSASPYCAHRHGPEGEVICHRLRSQIGANTRVPPSTEHDDESALQTIAFDDYLCSQCRAAVPPRLHQLEHVRFGNRRQPYTTTGAPFDATESGDITQVGCEGCQRTADETLGGAGGRNI